MSKELKDPRTLRQILQEYCDRGWYLFPLIRETKMPAIEDNLKRASKDIEQLKAWANQFPKCNWGLSLAKSGLVAVDIDEAGLDAWAEYEFEHSEPNTLKARSGSGIGSHYVFRADPTKRYRGKVKTDIKGNRIKGIDVKHNGYIAIYPSVHPTTGQHYQFVNTQKPADVPPWLRDLITKDIEEKRDASKYNLSNRFYTRIIEQLREKDFGYDEWLKLGMSLHAAFQGSAEGLDLYLYLTEGKNYKAGDTEKATDKWNSFTHNDSGVSGGSFIHVARELGCEIPNPEFENDLELFRQAQEEQGDDVPDERKEKPRWKHDEDGIKYSVHKNFIIDSLNKEFAVLKGGGTGTIIHYRTDEEGEKHVHVLKPERFRTALAPYHFKEIIMKNGEPWSYKYHAASTLWLKSNFRETFDDIVFEPNPIGKVFNLWTGIPCVAVEGDVSILTDFIRDIICDKSTAKAEYIFDWLAHIVQRPEDKSITVPTLIGEQGTGKGLFTDGILRGILKKRYIRIDKPGVIMERFNVEQSKKFVTVLDEASWRGNHELANVMKSLTGNDTMTVEEKHGGRYAIKNYSRYVITSNEKEAVFLEPTNRRYLVLELSSLNIRDDKYYSRIWGELEKNQLVEKFYNFLMKRDLSNFNAKKFPVHLDDAGQDTKVSSMGAVGAFWFDCFFEHPQALFVGNVLQKEPVYSTFLNYCNETRQWQKGLSRQKFWRESKNLIPLLASRESRHESGGSFQRVIRATPYELAKAFCERNRLDFPENFDDLELLAETDFINEEAP